MEKNFLVIKSAYDRKLVISAFPGHFATMHSHINYYIDMTRIKHIHTYTQIAASQLASSYAMTPIDTIVCLENCEMLGGYIALELSKYQMRGINARQDICVISPEYAPHGQLIFRENLQPMVENQKILLLASSVTTGKTVQKAKGAISYYKGDVLGISAIFSAMEMVDSIPVKALFTGGDLPDYCSYSIGNCPECQKDISIDAIVNSFGYSPIN